jgi:hypothetical protein
MSAPASPRNGAMPGANGSLGASSLHRESRALTGQLLAFDRIQTLPA